MDHSARKRLEALKKDMLLSSSSKIYGKGDPSVSEQKFARELEEMSVLLINLELVSDRDDDDPTALIFSHLATFDGSGP